MDLTVTQQHIDSALESERAAGSMGWDVSCECPTAQALMEQGHTDVCVGCFSATADGHQWNYPYATEQAIRRWRTMKPMTLVLEEE